jgi:hypothetical protein
VVSIGSGMGTIKLWRGAGFFLRESPGSNESNESRERPDEVRDLENCGGLFLYWGDFCLRRWYFRLFCLYF